jgi:hypothetical protein
MWQVKNAMNSEKRKNSYCQNENENIPASFLNLMILYGILELNKVRVTLKSQQKIISFYSRAPE